MPRIHPLVLAAVVAACASGGRVSTTHGTHARHAVGVVADELPLRVHNNSPTEMKILVVTGGAWKYIGSVPARSSASFEIGAEDWSGAPLRVLAAPVSGRGAAHSDPLTVLPGQTITFTIEPDLTRSSTTVR